MDKVVALVDGGVRELETRDVGRGDEVLAKTQPPLVEAATGRRP